MLRVALHLFLLVSYASSYNIVVYNVRFGHSHSNYLGRIADILVESGHNVTSLIPIIYPNQKDGTAKSHIIHVPQHDETKKFLKKFLSTNADWIWELNPSAVSEALSFGDMMKGYFCEQCDATLSHPALLEQLRAFKVDVFITETVDFCGVGIAHAIAAKSTIVVSSSSLYENVAQDIGVPVVPAFNPSFATLDLDIGSIWSRALNIYRTTTEIAKWLPSTACTNDVFRGKFGEDFSNIRDLIGQSAFVFTNSEPLIDFSRPLLRKVVDLGGIGMEKPKKLDEHWDKVLSMRSRAVLVSFGSIAKSASMRDERKHALLKAFSEFPDVTFIWKYEEPEDDFALKHISSVKNIVLNSWMPQNDLLRDPRVTAFISHAGMGSCQEAAAGGVPGLFIPLFADQFRNAAMMEYSGIGITLDKAGAADHRKVAGAIRKLLDTESLHINAKRIASMLAARPFTPRDLLVKHVEFAAQFGPSDALTPRGIHLNWIQYFLIDIIALTFIISSLLLILISYTIYRLTKACCYGSKKPKED